MVDTLVVADNDVSFVVELAAVVLDVFGEVTDAVVVLEPDEL